MRFGDVSAIGRCVDVVCIAGAAIGAAGGCILAILQSVAGVHLNVPFPAGTITE